MSHQMAEYAYVLKTEAAKRIDTSRQELQLAKSYLNHVKSGTPYQSTPESWDFYYSLRSGIEQNTNAITMFPHMDPAIRDQATVTQQHIESVLTSVGTGFLDEAQAVRRIVEDFDSYLGPELNIYVVAPTFPSEQINVSPRGRFHRVHAVPYSANSPCSPGEGEVVTSLNPDGLLYCEFGELDNYSQRYILIDEIRQTVARFASSNNRDYTRETLKDSRLMHVLRLAQIEFAKNQAAFQVIYGAEPLSSIKLAGQSKEVGEYLLQDAPGDAAAATTMEQGLTVLEENLGKVEAELFEFDESGTRIGNASSEEVVLLSLFTEVRTAVLVEHPDFYNIDAFVQTLVDERTYEQKRIETVLGISTGVSLGIWGALAIFAPPLSPIGQLLVEITGLASATVTGTYLYQKIDRMLLLEDAYQSGLEPSLANRAAYMAQRQGVIATGAWFAFEAITTAFGFAKLMPELAEVRSPLGQYLMRISEYLNDLPKAQWPRINVARIASGMDGTLHALTASARKYSNEIVNAIDSYTRTLASRNVYDLFVQIREAGTVSDDMVAFLRQAFHRNGQLNESVAAILESFWTGANLNARNVLDDQIDEVLIELMGASNEKQLRSALVRTLDIPGHSGSLATQTELLRRIRTSAHELYYQIAHTQFEMWGIAGDEAQEAFRLMASESDRLDVLIPVLDDYIAQSGNFVPQSMIQNGLYGLSAEYLEASWFDEAITDVMAILRENGGPIALGDRLRGLKSYILQSVDEPTRFDFAVFRLAREAIGPTLVKDLASQFDEIYLWQMHDSALGLSAAFSSAALEGAQAGAREVGMLQLQRTQLYDLAEALHAALLYKGGASLTP
ncbi:MAG: hypothetical protein IPJ88_04165 [Myxococcales bacterium]|nr:MAG: hypothetical protein IPJ88_04165 [Myxococcales bacterium]